MNAYLSAIIKLALLCLVIVGVVGLITLFWVIPGQVRTPEVAVPNLAGQDHERAVQLLHSVGLRPDPEIERRPSAAIPQGHVTDQNPPASFKIKQSAYVRLTLSSGSETVAAPDVAGKVLNDAQLALQSAGFKRGRVAAVHSDRYPQLNTVIAQTPQAGVMSQKGASVHLLLSLGPRPKVLRVPDLRRMAIDEARELLESHGLRIGEEVYQPHPELNKGLIIRHQPSAGELVAIGGVIDFEISGSRRLQRGRLHRILMKYRVSGTGGLTKHVRIVVEDERGKPMEVVNAYYEPGMLIEKPPQPVMGNAVMRIYEDSELVKMEAFDW